MQQQIAYRNTPVTVLAVLVLLFIPGLMVAAFGELICNAILGRIHAYTYWGDVGWFDIVRKVIIPSTLPPLLAGFLVIRVAFAIKPLRQANFAIAAYIAIAAFVALHAAMFLGAAMSPRMIEVIANTVGMTGGLFAGQWFVRRQQARLALESQSI